MARRAPRALRAAAWLALSALSACAPKGNETAGAVETSAPAAELTSGAALGGTRGPSGGDASTPAVQASFRRARGTDGPAVSIAPPGEARWHFALEARAFGCEGDVHELAAVDPDTAGSRVAYRREGVVEWYEQRPRGIEQGFDVLARPACHARTGLVIDVATEGDLSPELAGDGRVVDLRDASGATRLHYGELAVKDAAGRDVPARFALSQRGIALRIDDRGFAYPLHVDPLLYAQQAKLVASDGAALDSFGTTIAASGNTVVVGAPFHTQSVPSSGAAYVFVQTGGGWVQEAELVAGDASENMGFATQAGVAISFDTAVIGSWTGSFASEAGAAYVFVRSNGAWTQQAKLVASDADAGDHMSRTAVWWDTAVVGAEGDDEKGTDAGAAYVFVRSGGIWTQQAKLLASDGAATNRFGTCVAVAGDTAVIGTDSLSGTSGTGTGAYVFVRSGNVWTQQAKLVPSDGVLGNSFGAAVAVSGDRAIVGAPDREAAWVFYRSAGVWTEEAKLVPPPDGVLTTFGWSVAISGDTATVGSYGSDAYVFVRTSGQWALQQPLNATDSQPIDGFGYAVALTDAAAFVTSPFANDSQGSAYVFVSTGQTCACPTGFCKDGVCCVEACTGVCQSCDQPQAPGACLPVLGAEDPDTCAGANRCDASGACKLATGQTCAAGSDCATGFCADGFCCESACAAPCDVCAASLGAVADGVCTIAPVGSLGDGSCGAYACVGTITCGALCASDLHCAPDFYCALGGTCEPRRAIGAACDASAGGDCAQAGCRVCATGSCADGVCCDKPCDGSCDVCAKALGAVADGTCGLAPAGSAGSPSCAPYACSGATASCPSACTSDADCAALAFCDASGACVPSLEPGAICATSAACASGFCVDGYCCDRACSDQCEACNAPGTKGTCVPIAGAPQGSREPCSSGMVDEPCLARACDGSDPTQCAGYVGSSVACRAPSCTNGVATLAAKCDGAGNCPEVKEPCEPFACGPAACQTACRTDADCAPGYACNASDGTCAAGGSCDGDHTIVRPGASSIDCSPYRCEGTSCKTSCTSIVDCVGSASCDDAGHCVTAAGADGSAAGDSGCGCAVPGRNSGDGRAVVLLAVAVMAAARRRRWTLALAALLAGCSHPDDESAGLGQAADALVFAEQAKLVPSDGTLSGPAASLSGNTAVLAQPGIDALGAAYVFVRSGNVWAQEATLVSSDAAAGDFFGIAVAIDGDTAVVGAPDINDPAAPGAAYVFQRTGGVWTQQAKLTASDPSPGAWFGFRVSISGDSVVIGASWDAPAGDPLGAAYVFVRAGGVWSEQAKLVASDAYVLQLFGSSVAISLDTILVGASDPYQTGQGAAYVFGRSGSTWTEKQKLAPSDPDLFDGFGDPVRVDGDTAIVGASSHEQGGVPTGAAYVFVTSGGPWSEQAKLTGDGAVNGSFGSSVAVWNDTAVVGEPGGSPASAYAFTRAGGAWSLQTKLLPSDGTPGQVFGNVVSISGSTILVAADGGGYVFELSGQPCASSADCATGYCRDGVCCAKACDGSCVSCNQGAAAGACLPVHDAVDPDTCAGANRCDASGTCKLAEGQGCTDPSTCASTFCADGVCCSGSCTAPCDVCAKALGAVADGVCSIAPAGQTPNPTCGGYACNGTSAGCGTVCSSDLYCAAGTFCAADGTCTPQKPQAMNCDDAAGADCLEHGCRVCSTGVCADGFCCDTPCDGSCDVCAEALGATANGTCSPAPAGSAGWPTCAPYTCSGTGPSCATSCTGDGACAPDAFCNAGACVGTTPIGQACTAGDQCASGFCVDGVCCSAACVGQCEACDAQGAVGTCVPIVGAPHGQRPACFAGVADAPCLARTCDGTEPASCAGFVGSAVSCRAASCTNDVATLAAQCDGKGACPLVETKPCDPFRCDASACKSSCMTGDDCAQGKTCDTETGKCLMSATCDGASTVVSPDGTRVDCTPYKCDSGACKTSCGSIVDCLGGALCDDRGQCVRSSAATPSEGDGGCGCNLPGSGRRGLALSAWLMLALAAGRRLRARSRGAQRRPDGSQPRHLGP